MDLLLQILRFSGSQVYNYLAFLTSQGYRQETLAANTLQPVRPSSFLEKNFPYLRLHGFLAGMQYFPKFSKDMVLNTIFPGTRHGHFDEMSKSDISPCQRKYSRIEIYKSKVAGQSASPPRSREQVPGAKRDRRLVSVQQFTPV